MNLLFIDTETTGLSPRDNEIIELAAAIEIDGVTQCEFVLYFRPEKWSNISKEALAVNGWTVERLKRLKRSCFGWSLFMTIVEECKPVNFKKFKIVEHSKNGNFDYNFLKSSLYGSEDREWFSETFQTKPINTRDLAKRKFPREKNLALKDCARLLNIPFDDKRHHGAMYDMQICREIYRRCAK